MKVKCKRIFSQPGTALIHSGVKNNDKDGSLGPGRYFKNLKYGEGLITQAAELSLLVEINGETIPISIDKQFRRKFKKLGTTYANLTGYRISRIKETMPAEIEVEKTGNSRHPYKVEERAIDAWYSQI